MVILKDAVQTRAGVHSTAVPLPSTLIIARCGMWGIGMGNMLQAPSVMHLAKTLHTVPRVPCFVVANLCRHIITGFEAHRLQLQRANSRPRSQCAPTSHWPASTSTCTSQLDVIHLISVLRQPNQTPRYTTTSFVPSLPPSPLISAPGTVCDSHHADHFGLHLEHLPAITRLCLGNSSLNSHLQHNTGPHP